MTMKLVDVEQLEADLTRIADAIRAKAGNEDVLSFPDGFISAIEFLPEWGPGEWE